MTEKPDDLVIRTATVDDLHELVELSSMAADENGFIPSDAARMATEIWPALHLDHGMVGVIGKKGGIIEGAVLLRIGPMWYANEDRLVLEERGVFIHPDYRAARGGRARRLCEFSKKAADDLGIPLLIGVLSNSRTEGKSRLYRRIFGEPAGAFFLYNATTGQASRTEH